MIKKIETYSAEEIQALRRASPASDRYLDLLQNSATRFELKLESQLRVPRMRAWVEAALATFHQSHSAEEICAAWSVAADRMIQSAADAHGLEELGIAIFALGKLGARELNLSSDVDLILLSKDPPDTSVNKPIREFIKVLSGTTEFGNGFRVDLDLRPGGPAAPLVCHLSRFQDHYWSQSELWERMALVRLRPIYGSQELIDEVMQTRDQFCFRKYLDFSLLEELKRLRPKIHNTAQKIPNPDIINLKLNSGFIRDIELFINAHQIMYGGKDTLLRVTSTTAAAQRLHQVRAGQGEFLKLIEIYWTYRQWENQVQAVQDFQTHDLNLAQPPPGWNWPQRKSLEKLSQYIDQHISDLLGSVKTGEIQAGSLQLSDEDLLSMGFSVETVTTVWPEVLKASVLSRQRDVDEAKRIEVITAFVHELAASAFDKDLGLDRLKDFLVSTRAKATFFHLLAKERKLIKDLSFLFGLSPYLGSLFSNRPELLDSFLFNQDQSFSMDMEKALIQMAERKRLTEIRVALNYLSSFNLGHLTQGLTQTADDITLHLLNLLENEFKTKDLSLLALGKWGGQEVGFKSDLDFIFVCSRIATEAEHKLVRRFISRLRDPSMGGTIYNIDVRLRPEGKGGPLIVERSSLFEFVNKTAAAWERQAYLKARWVGRDEVFQDEIDFSRGLSSGHLAELKTIRGKLIHPLPATEIPLKMGQGGLLDIELMLQTLVLHGRVPVKSGSTMEFFRAVGLEGSFLHQHYLRLRQVEQTSRLLSLEMDPKLSSQKNFVQLAARLLSTTTETLITHLRSEMAHAHEEIKKIDPTYSGESS